MKQNKDNVRRNCFSHNPKCEWFLLGISFLVLLISVIWMCTQINKQNEAVDFKAPPFETELERASASDLFLRSDSLIEAGDLKFFVEGPFVETDDSVKLTVWNSDESSTLIRVRVLDMEGKILGESGLIQPGELLKKIVLDQPIDKSGLILTIMGYEPDTYYSAGTIKLTVPGEEITIQ